jgi:hypothetical protein
MTTIPTDILQKAEAAYLAALHDSMAGKPNFLKHVGLAILAERERCIAIAERHSPAFQDMEYTAVQETCRSIADEIANSEGAYHD